jgi:lambda family phage minor tail protein L
MTLQSTTQSLDLEHFIDLITIEALKLDKTVTTIRICNFLEGSFGGQFYQQFPCQISGFSKSGDDTEIRGVLTVSDISGIAGDVVDAAYIVGSKVSVKRTQERFLDGKPTADSSQYFGFEMRINSYDGEYQNQFVFNLAPYYSLERKKLPARTYSRRCQWKLNMPQTPDENCGARTDIHFDINGNVTNLENRACRKDLAACKLYHGHTLRFGGFPGVVRARN